MRLEVCCDDMQSVKAAIAGGADRVEVCYDLGVGGVTPEFSLVREAVATGIPVHALIRCRPGNFVYTGRELRLMQASIYIMKGMGVKGVVWGALTEDNEIDWVACMKMAVKSDGLSVTFHRAFDEVRDPAKALEELIELGCDRVLTSGHAQDMVAGKDTLRDLVKQARGRIGILPGGGLKPDNARMIMEYTGVTEIHGSLRKIKYASREYVKRVRRTLDEIEKERALV